MIKWLFGFDEFWNPIKSNFNALKGFGTSNKINVDRLTKTKKY